MIAAKTCLGCGQEFRRDRRGSQKTWQARRFCGLVNGDRADNRLDNLELRSGQHGKGAAMCCVSRSHRNLVPWTIG